MSKMSVILAGDFCTAANAPLVDESFAKNLLRDMKPILDKADFRIVNLECVLCEEGVGAPIPKSGPNLRGLPKNISVLREGGFDCAVLANNHFGDYGTPAIESTLSVLRDERIASCGGGMNLEQAYRAFYTEKDGVRVAFIAVCENEFGCADETTPGAAGYSMKLLADRMEQEHARADFVVVIFHGGNENNAIPSPVAVDRYRLLTTLGADAVVAMHTHCMQGYETYRGKPIIYSMGNWFFKSRWGIKPDNDPWNNGYMTELVIEKGKNISFNVIPYGLWEDCTYLHVHEGETKQRVLAYLEEISAVISDTELLWKYYYAWCTSSGADYAKAAVYNKEYEGQMTEQLRREISPLKNLFGCEAHNHLLKTTLRLQYEGKFEEARAALPALMALKQMPY